MKKYVIGVAACFLVMGLVTGFANAQVAWSGGVKGGVNLAKLTGDDASDFDKYRTGAIVGGFVTAQVHQSFAVQLEVLYAQKGGKAEQSVPDTTLKVTAKLDYIQIPVLAVGKFPAGEKAMFDIFAGPAVSFNAVAKLAGEITANGQTNSPDDVDIKDSTKSVDFGLIFGAGVEFKVAERVNILLDARYDLGLVKIDDPTEGDAADVKTSAIGIMAGVSIPFGAGGGS